MSEKIVATVAELKRSSLASDAHQEEPIQQLSKIFRVNFSFGPHLSTWEVIRSYDDFTKLRNELLEFEYNKQLHQVHPLNHYLNDAGMSYFERVEQMELYLNKSLLYYRYELWKTPSLLSFVSDGPQHESIISNIQISILSHDIQEVKAKQIQYEEKLRIFERTQTLLYDTVQKLTTVGGKGPPDFSPGDDALSILSKSSPYSTAGSNQATPKGLTGNEIALVEFADSMTMENYRIFAENQKDISADSTTRSMTAWSSPDSSSAKTGFLQNSLLLVKMFSSSSSKSLPHSIYLPESILPLREKCLHFNSAIYDLLQPILPHNGNYQYRQSILAFLKKQIRRLFHCSSFEIGIGRVKAFLPDDPMKLCIIVGRNSTISWHSILSDRLNALAEKGMGDGEYYDAMYESSNAEGGDVDEAAILCRHIVSTSTYTKPSSQLVNAKVTCRVDSLEIEIISNNRHDLCMLSFLEEVSRLVGRDHLFKQSMLLIRSWWTYETVAYVQCQVKYYLPDFALCMMVCSIFNQYYAQISSPFQALCLFLAEYADYDGSFQAITLQGIVPFNTELPNEPDLIPPRDDTLIPSSLLDTYIHMLKKMDDKDSSSSSKTEDPATSPMKPSQLSLDTATTSAATQTHRQQQQEAEAAAAVAAATAAAAKSALTEGGLGSHSHSRTHSHSETPYSSSSAGSVGSAVVRDSRSQRLAPPWEGRGESELDQTAQTTGDAASPLYTSYTTSPVPFAEAMHDAPSMRYPPFSGDGDDLGSVPGTMESATVDLGELNISVHIDGQGVDLRPSPISIAGEGDDKTVDSKGAGEPDKGSVAGSSAASTSSASNKDNVQQPFERLGFNIVHPFTGMNMVTEKISQRRLSRISKAFQIGASNLAELLRKASTAAPSTAYLQDSSPSTTQPGGPFSKQACDYVVQSFFQIVLSKFSDVKSRPDMIGSLSASGLRSFRKRMSTRANPSDFMASSLHEYKEHIEYCNFFLESIISESALLSVSTEILTNKGPLAVGEIGKVLADITAIPNLSLKLKDRFGGLKKFLEYYSDKFAISNDHPFNPHVVLRKTLSPENLDLVDRGIFPPQLLARKAAHFNVKRGMPAVQNKRLSHGEGSFTPYRGGDRDRLQSDQRVPSAYRDNNNPSTAVYRPDLDPSMYRGAGVDRGPAYSKQMYNKGMERKISPRDRTEGRVSPPPISVGSYRYTNSSQSQSQGQSQGQSQSQSQHHNQQYVIQLPQQQQQQQQQQHQHQHQQFLSNRDGGSVNTGNNSSNNSVMSDNTRGEQSMRDHSDSSVYSEGTSTYRDDQHSQHNQPISQYEQHYTHSQHGNVAHVQHSQHSSQHPSQQHGSMSPSMGGMAGRGNEGAPALVTGLGGPSGHSTMPPSRNVSSMQPSSGGVYGNVPPTSHGSGSTMTDGSYSSSSFSPHTGGGGHGLGLGGPGTPLSGSSHSSSGSSNPNFHPAMHSHSTSSHPTHIAMSQSQPSGQNQGPGGMNFMQGQGYESNRNSQNSLASSPTYPSLQGQDGGQRMQGDLPPPNMGLPPTMNTDPHGNEYRRRPLPPPSSPPHSHNNQSHINPHSTANPSHSQHIAHGGHQPFGVLGAPGGGGNYQHQLGQGQGQVLHHSQQGQGQAHHQQGTPRNEGQVQVLNLPPGMGQNRPNPGPPLAQSGTNYFDFLDDFSYSPGPPFN